MAVHRHFPRNGIPLSETIEAWLLIASIGLAVWLANSDVIPMLIGKAEGLWLLISVFLEGFFFTSVLTTAPAIIAIVESAAYVPAWKLAAIGALGAVCGDMLIFRFVQSRLVERILRVAFHPKAIRFAEVLARSALWWIAPLGGAIVIASPLPDEIGLIMMGLSGIRLIQFIPLSLVANGIGIYLMALAAQSLH